MTTYRVTQQRNGKYLATVSADTEAGAYRTALDAVMSQTGKTSNSEQGEILQEDSTNLAACLIEDILPGFDKTLPYDNVFALEPMSD